MADTIDISYFYNFRDGTTKSFTCSLSPDSLKLQTATLQSPPSWAGLSKNRCANCTLDEAEHPYCPVAFNLAAIAEDFKEHFAYEEVSVTVKTEPRTYSKDTTVQEGLSALIGIVMVSSGCPVMEYLKPMVRFHLPFATLAETIFRMTSVYLLSRYFRHRDGMIADWNLEEIERIYAEVGQVNRDFSLRIQEAAKKDANANALVNLDCIASLIPLAVEDTLKEIRPYFSAYLR